MPQNKKRAKTDPDPPDFARLQRISITCPSVNMTNFEEPPAPSALSNKKYKKKRGKIRSECTSISDVVYLGCICICISVLLWHKPIKPRLIGHVKWRNRARTQVWHFIIISTASAAPTLYRVYQSGPVSHDRSICICIFLYFCIFSEWVSAPEMLFDR